MRKVTSGETEIEFDNIISSFVEVKDIRSNVGVLSGLVEVLLYHVEKLCALREGAGLFGKE